MSSFNIFKNMLWKVPIRFISCGRRGVACNVFTGAEDCIACKKSPRLSSGHCHSERSEESRSFDFAQDDCVDSSALVPQSASLGTAKISSEILSNLSFISFAALLVKVTARIFWTGIYLPRMR